MEVKDIMSKNVVSLTSDDTVQKLISLMEKYHFHEIPVIDNGRLKGLVSTKILTQKAIKDPSKEKVKTMLMSQTPTLDSFEDIDVAANKLLKTGLRAIPVTQDNKVIGMVSLHDIVNEISKNKQFRQTKAAVLMSQIKTISDQDDLGKARVVMRENNISHLPIVDKNNMLVGIVTAFDMLKAVKPKEKINYYSMAAEMEKVMQLPVSIVMNAKPVTTDQNTSLIDIADLMERNKVSNVVITENKQPKGIIVLKDLLEFYVGGLEKKGLYYQIIGMSDEDDFIAGTVNRMIEDTIKKISSSHKIQFMFIHVKKHETGIANRTKYSVRIRMRTDKDFFISKAWAWDLRSAANQSLDNLERAVFKLKETVRTVSRKNIKKAKSVLRR
ncbi:MAG: CBS domain-containing protein [Candidatus Aenigmarchaeota archaeon]|nr:CBS domain-containing protein [Candidatus Aenigmarchaeota archaeon]